LLPTFQRAFGDDCYNSPPLALALADHPKLSVLMLGGNFLKEARVTTASRPFVESNPFALIYVFSECAVCTGGRNNRRRPRRSVREASDDRGFTEVVGLNFTWENGDISAYLVGPASRLTRLITDASDEDVLNPYRFQGIEVTSA